MAVHSDILSLYDVGGSTLKGSGPLREQLLNNVYNTDPDETPFASMLPHVKVNGPLVQWLTDSLPADSAIALGEVDGTEAASGSYMTNVVPVRDDNVVMSLRADLNIADDVLDADQAGYEDALAFHISKWEKAWEIKREKIFLDPEVTRNDGSESVARVIDNFAAFTSAAAVSTTMPGAGTNVSAIIEDDFNDGIVEYWRNGGKGRVVLLDMDTMRQVQSTFFGLAKTVSSAEADRNSNQRNMDISSGTLYASVEFYRAVTGAVYAFVVDRHLNVPVDGGALDTDDSRIYIVDRNMAAIGDYKPLRSVPLAKTGSSSKVMLRGAFTLLVYNTKAQYSYKGSA